MLGTPAASRRATTRSGEAIAGLPGGSGPDRCRASCRRPVVRREPRPRPAALLASGARLRAVCGAPSPARSSRLPGRARGSSPRPWRPASSTRYADSEVAVRLLTVLRKAGLVNQQMANQPGVDVPVRKRLSLLTDEAIALLLPPVRTHPPGGETGCRPSTWTRSPSTSTPTRTRLYAIVADVTRHPELSPELERVTWLGRGHPAPSPAPGSRRSTAPVGGGGRGGTDRSSRSPSPAGRSPGRARSPSPARCSGATGSSPRRGGTRVTESYEVTRPIGRVGWFVIGTVFGCRDWRGDLRAGMTTSPRPAGGDRPERRGGRTPRRARPGRHRRRARWW